MKNRIWAACMALLLANISILFYVYGYATSGEEKIAAQSISRLISTYAEPQSNPVFLVRAEDRCRFYGHAYCPAAEAQRASALALFNIPITLSTKPSTEAFYEDYLAARARLIKTTDNYARFLSSHPSTDDYVTASAAFEEEAGGLIGVIVSNLYALQDIALRDSDRAGNWAFAAGYLCNFVLFVLIACARRMTQRKRS